MLDPPFSPDVRTACTSHTHTRAGHTGSNHSSKPENHREKQISIQEVPLSQVNKHFQYELVIIIAGGVVVVVKGRIVVSSVVVRKS